MAKAQDGRLIWQAGVFIELRKCAEQRGIKERLDVKFKMDFTPGASATTLEQTVAAAMPPLKQVDVLVRYQTTLDRQLSKSIGELMVLKANVLLTEVRQLQSQPLDSIKSGVETCPSNSLKYPVWPVVSAFKALADIHDLPMVTFIHISALLVLMSCLALSGYAILSVLYSGRRHLLSIEILPCGFSLYAVSASVFYSGAFYFSWGLRAQIHFNQAFLVIGIIAAGALLFLRRTQPKINAFLQPSLRIFLVYYAPVIAALAISSYVFGRYPFFVSDDFGHLTIINRMIHSASLATPFLYMPDDVQYHSFFPWHGILASLAGTLGYGALDVFTAAKTFLTVTVVLSFMSFCVTLFRDEQRAHLYVLCCAVVYALFAPEVFIFHGVGDYRGISYIFMFQAARILWITAVFRAAQKRHLLVFGFLMLGVSLIHPIDLPTFLLMFFPYLLFVTARAKNAKGFLTLLMLGATTGAIGLAVKTVFYSRTAALPLHYVVEVKAFWKYYISRLDNEFGIVLILVALVGSVMFGHGNRRATTLVWWPVGALVASFGLGSANPLLMAFYAKVMSADLMERTMYSFPMAVPLGSALAGLSIQVSASLRRRRFPYSIVFVLLILTAMGHQAWIRYGLNGEPTYAWPSADYALLATQPKLFEYIAKLENKVILTDMLTSAPITAVSSNFTYTNRPWVELKQSRIPEALTMMQTVGNGDLAPSFCRNGIDVLVLNPKPPFARHPAYIFDDFYRMYVRPPSEKHLAHVADLDGASIYVFGRKLACP